MTTGPRAGMLPGMLLRRCCQLVSASGAACLLSSCTGGTETGNPPFAAALSYTGYSSAPEDYAIREPGRVLSLRRAWLDLGEVRVSTAGGCAIEGTEELTVPALGVGDHAAGGHNYTAFNAQPGAFCTLELPFSRTTSARTGDGGGIAGHSILLEGELADGTPFSIASDAEATLRLSAEAGGFTLSADRPDTLVVFDFARWLRDLSFDKAVKTEGAIVISGASNADLLEVFESHLAEGARLYRDADGDGQLDAEPELLASPR